MPQRPIEITPDGSLLLILDGATLRAVTLDHQTVWAHEVGAVGDIALVGPDVWIATPGSALVRRLDLQGRPIADITLPVPLTPGRWWTSSAAAAAVWHGETTLAIRPDGPVAIPASEAAAPIIEGRWLLWRAGTAAVWHSIGDAWRVPLADPGATLVDARALFEGRMIALGIQGRVGEESRLVVISARDGGVLSSLRLAGVERVRFAPRRSLAVVQLADRLMVVDLRFGRVLRELPMIEPLVDFVVDDTLQTVAWTTGDAVEACRWTDFEHRATGTHGETNGVSDDAEPAPAGPLAAERPPPGLDRSPAEATRELREASRDLRDPRAGRAPRDAALDRSADGPRAADGRASIDRSTAEATRDLRGDLPAAPAPPEPPPPPADDEPLPAGELLGLSPLRPWPEAAALEARRSLDARLDLLGARVGLAIAEAWDRGALAQPDGAEPPFAAEVAGLLRQTSGRAPIHLGAARARCVELEQQIGIVDKARGNRLIPLEQLGRQFGLTPLAAALLVIAAGPQLRGELARLYGILANDPGRPLCDEHLVMTILSTTSPDAITRELDRDRPLRRYGLVQLAENQPRPFAALTVEPLVARILRGLPLDADPETFVKPRTADRTLDELRMPRAPLRALLSALSSERDTPVRIVVRGRVGSGRHSLLAALAARANRTLGVIDLTSGSRDPNRIVESLRATLRRCLVRGWLPCIDSLDTLLNDESDLKFQLAAILNDHPGPLSLRLSPEAQPPLEPGYLRYDIPVLDEREREPAWAAALARRNVRSPDTAELAARYRVGPGVIERVVAEISRHDYPDGAAAARAIDAGVRQHLENRIGTVATRVTRLPTWSDVILPDDILDSLLAITGRIRYRKTVFERWGYGRSITTARGITALFSGSPGTGKTMVAGVLARDLGVELYRVDVSRITSKWIGETEKNLANLFDAAEDGQVMLLFDEADSLFAKRTEVKTSVDRYANMEVNYLLQRLDSFEGIAILTSNFGTAIDPAFKRRLSFRVTFPFPDEEMREALWRTLIPADVPRSGTFDLAGLARRYKLSGGYIRNASLRAAFLAAEEGLAMTQEHIERAITTEFREIGKLADSGTLE